METFSNFIYYVAISVEIFNGQTWYMYMPLFDWEKVYGSFKISELLPLKLH